MTRSTPPLHTESLSNPVRAGEEQVGAARANRVRLAGWIIALLLGFIQAWRSRHAMSPDGVSYLDIADAYIAGDWSAAINAYWSPLYSWLLAGALFLIRPSPYWEFTVVHVVNFGIYVLSLWAFEFLLTEVIRTRREHTSAGTDESAGVGDEWAWRVVGYSLFIWSGLDMISLTWVTPDMCAAALVYLAAAILLRLGDPRAPTWLALILGVTLGFGYLAKSAMLPLAFVFIGTGLIAWEIPRGLAVRRALLAVCGFAGVAGPYVIVLSRAKGYPTWGAVGKLIYAWCVERVANSTACHTDAIDPTTPVHATRQISVMPAIYEFATPIGGTYPPWYDPSYWYRDLRVSLSPGRMMARLVLQFLKYLPRVAPIVAVVMIWVVSAQHIITLRRFRRLAPLTLPSVAALVMYGLVHVEPRYIGPFVLLLSLGALAGLPVSPQGKADSLLKGTAVGLATVLVAPLCVSLLLNAAVLVTRPQLSGPAAHAQWQVAQALHENGVGHGGTIAAMGGELAPGWARLARVKVVAQLPPEDADRFWASDSSARARVKDVLSGTGARAVVTSSIPPWAPRDTWRPLGATGYHVLMLQQ